MKSDVENELPMVSVIIPVYNDNDRLKLCLDLLQKQSYPSDKIEIIVVDNGSDVMPDFIDGRYTNVRLLSEAKKSSYAARNKGINASIGEVLAFTDADCQPDADWVRNGVKALLSQEKDIIAGGPVKLIYHISDKPNACELLETAFNFNQKEYIRKMHYTVTANLFARRRVFDKVGFFNDNVKSGGDQEWGKRAFDMGYDIIYFENIIIRHPSRHLFSETLRKRKRVTLGLCDLAKGDKQYRLRLFIKLAKIFPSFRYITLPILRDKRFGAYDKLRMLSLVFVLHYYSYWFCLIHAHYLLYPIKGKK